MESKKFFNVGNEKRELFFSYAVQQRLIGQFSLDKLEGYLLDPLFSIRATGLLLLGKKMRELANVEDILDSLEELGLTSDQGHEITVWVREAILNFSQEEIRKVKEQIQKILPSLVDQPQTSSSTG